MSEKVKNFRDLRIWQKSMDLICDIYALTETFPKGEAYDLVSQTRRAAISIPANIPEGFNRFHKKNMFIFSNISLGSCSELETHIEICSRLAFISEDITSGILERLDHISRMTRKLIKNLTSLTPNTEERTPRTV